MNYRKFVVDFHLTQNSDLYIKHKLVNGSSEQRQCTQNRPADSIGHVSTNKQHQGHGTEATAPRP